MAKKAKNSTKITKQRTPPKGIKRWEADPQKRGSAEPIPGRCGAKIPKSDPPRYCKLTPVPGSGTSPMSKPRCKWHGGMSARGENHYTARAGRAKSLWTAAPDELQGAMRSAMSDPDLRHMREVAALLYGRLTQLTERLTTFESSTAWKNLVGGVDQLSNELVELEERLHRDLGDAYDDLADDPFEPIRETLDGLVTLVEEGLGEKALWDQDLAPTIRLLKETTDSDARQRKYLAEAMSLEQAGIFQQLLLRAVNEVMGEEDRVKVGMKMARYLQRAGHQIEVPEDYLLPNGQEVVFEAEVDEAKDTDGGPR